jgi:hypothetical protein
MPIAARAMIGALSVLVAALIGAAPATAAPKPPTVSFSYDATLFGEPLVVQGTLTLTSVTTTTTTATITGELDATATWDGLSASLDDTISVTLAPTCDGTTATLTVDFGSFDVVFLGITYTIDPDPFTVTVAAGSTVGQIFCAFADVLADGASQRAVVMLTKRSLAAAA